MIEPVLDLEYEPEITLYDWQIKKVRWEDGTVTQHLVGNTDPDYGRVSSNIIAYIGGKLDCVITDSGRMYELKNPSARLSPDAQYVWNRWKGINGVEEVL